MNKEISYPISVLPEDILRRLSPESSAAYRLNHGDTPRFFLVRRNEHNEVGIQISYAWGERERPSWLRKGTLSIGYGENSSRILLVSLQPRILWFENIRLDDWAKRVMDKLREAFEQLDRSEWRMGPIMNHRIVKRALGLEREELPAWVREVLA